MRKNNQLIKKVPHLLQLTLNIALVLLAISLCILLAKELIFFVKHGLLNGEVKSNYQLLEHILTFFLYFEFIAMIVKYFKENYHFPLRYFLYIGITALIRLIIVSHTDALQTLFYTCAILVLVISYVLLNTLNIIKKKYEESE